MAMNSSSDAAIKEAFRAVTGKERDVLIRFLEGKNLIGPGPVIVTRLAGGVSNDVLAVHAPGVALVVKRALGRLRVAEEWFADPGRVLTEGAALSFASQSQPGSVPDVLLIDPNELVVVIGHAGSNAHEWKEDLLAGRIDPTVSVELGRRLGRWHLDSHQSSEVMARFSNRTAFQQLRVEPFYQWVSSQQADLSVTIGRVVERMLDTRTCLVHGDLSPKNILITPSRLWVIDWEVAHYGDPAFDIGFLLSHLACKALHMPSKTADYESVGRSFLSAYVTAVGDIISLDDSYLAAQTACLLLARMDGKSPVTYLEPPAVARGRAIARSFLSEPGGTLDDLWSQLS